MVELQVIKIFQCEAIPGPNFFLPSVGLFNLCEGRVLPGIKLELQLVLEEDLVAGFGFRLGLSNPRESLDIGVDFDFECVIRNKTPI